MLLSLLATSVGIAAFNFGGGDDHALLEAVTKHFGRPAAILASDTKWKAFHIKPQDLKDVQKLLRTLVKIDQSEPGRFGLSPLAWPLGVGNEPHFEEYSELFVPFPISEDAFRGGKYYLNTKGREALSFNTLATLKLEKPIRWQSFFDRVRLRVSIDGCSERELLDLVARASGAKLVEGKDIEFVIDPKAWRSRSVAMWREN